MTQPHKSITMPTTSIKTTCSYCGVGCGIIATKDERGHLTV
ncbi:MAG: ferredoxin-nitrate reductase, partial [Neolewinella sp.]